MVKILRDQSDEPQAPVQTQYLNLLMGLFLRTLVKAYAPENLSKTDAAKLRKYLERIIEAKSPVPGSTEAGD